MRTPSSPNTPVTLVGRDRELGILRDHLDAALAGHGSLVLIGGEAGIGKTALAEALCREASDRARWSCRALLRSHRDTALRPMARTLQAITFRLMPCPRFPSRSLQRGAVDMPTSQATSSNRCTTFSLLPWHSAPWSCLLDDLHWSDPASLDLLRSLARSLSSASVAHHRRPTEPMN